MRIAPNSAHMTFTHMPDRTDLNPGLFEKERSRKKIKSIGEFELGTMAVGIRVRDRRE